MSAKILFAINSKLDVYSEFDRGWIIGTIVEINEDQIKIHYFGWANKWDLWFPKDSKHLAALNTHTIPITPLSPPPNAGNHIFSPISDKGLIMYASKDGIYKYDIKNDNYCEIAQVACNQYTQLSYDKQKELLYITNGYANCPRTSPKFQDFVFDINKKKLTHHNKIVPIYMLKHKIVINHYSYNHQHLDVLHIFGYDQNAMYYECYDKEKQSSFYLNSFDGIKMVVDIPSEKKILFLGIDKCSEFYTKTDKAKKHCLSSIQSTIKMPQAFKFNFDTSYIMNIYDTLVVIIDIQGGNRQILFLDLMTNKWFKSDNIQCLIIVYTSQLIDGKDNYLYFMNIDKRTSEPFMFKIHWMDIIPRKLCKVYKDKKYKLLIHGFVKDFEKRHKLYYNVPFYLKEIILRYYPCFLYPSR